MTNTELLSRIKKALSITGTYHDDLLQTYIDSVKVFMQDSGVLESVINSEVSVGCILQGVSDLWNYSSGGVKFSEFFKMRVIQLTKTSNSKPIMSITLDIPTLEEVDLFGWHTVTSGIAFNMQAGAFTVDDDQTIKGIADFYDGTELTVENDGTGNRRRMIFASSKYAIVMPNTIYDISQSRFIDNEGTTCINVTNHFAGGRLLLDTFYKE